MERKELINRIINFYFKHGLYNKPIMYEEVKYRIEQGLEKYEFVEELIHMITIKTKNNNRIDVEKTIELLNSLDRVRLELEYKGRDKNER